MSEDMRYQPPMPTRDPHTARKPAPPLWVAILAVGAAVLGPRLTMPEERLAGAPFAYVPPADFAEETTPSPGRRADVTHVWRYVGSRPGGDPAPSINRVHSGSRATVEPADMLRVASEMPASQKAAGVEWTLLRSGTRDRPDGARVGFMEARVVQEGRPHRALQLAFPEDTGMSIVSATYTDADEGPGASAGSWAATVLDTIATATGVARRVPPPPSWVNAAWAAGGLAVGALVHLLRSRRPAKA